MFHPIDGAVPARTDGLEDEVVHAVLHHTGAYGEARRLRPELLSYYPNGCGMMSTTLSRALTFCDLRAGPSGENFSVADRLSDICTRHANNQELVENITEYSSAFYELDREFGHLLSHVNEHDYRGGS